MNPGGDRPKAEATLGGLWRSAGQRLGRRDARLLLEHACGCTHADLLARPELPVAADRVAFFFSLVARRGAGEPLAYLTGRAGFLDLDFEVTPAVLIPRPETELLVELVAERAQSLDAPRLLDLGTGSGVIAIALARLCPFAEVLAVDLSPEALAVAQRNAERHAPHVRFLAGDWYSPLGGERFDLIAANPPYVACGDPHLESGGLPFEPQVALTDGIAGGDGLSCIRSVVGGARAHLRSGGGLFLEHGYDQADSVRALLLAHGFSQIRTWPDLAGIDRVTGGRKI